ncbi:hypothetical protein CWE13_05025 [Aliidiomarina shirensis]|uniref:Formyl transferase N-terminal domain-containing protein n=1 Tax=Aliidiomarina shirensis TaxID=1048642 RepID=A0A432WUA0_9GAMM|nr:formyltransferase family protein [Aliidiomarina shirensis]RUO37328.1 hypothetical protein CWE13_05025 [Aliidiomarina shirensis]
MNIVIFGELPLATKILQFLQSFESINVPFVVCENYNAKNLDPWPETPMLYEYAASQNIPVIKLNELEAYCAKLSEKPVVGITARFSRILKENHLSVFENGIINLHGGLLPDFGGLYSVNHMLLSGNKIGGGSIHWIDLGIDTGALIKRCICDIAAEDNAFSLHQKVQASLLDGLKSVVSEGLERGFDKISHEVAPADAKPAYYSKGSLEGLREVAFSELGSEKALRTIRAFDFPGYEPAYTMIAGQKVFLRVTI